MQYFYIYCTYQWRKLKRWTIQVTINCTINFLKLVISKFQKEKKKPSTCFNTGKSTHYLWTNPINILSASIQEPINTNTIFYEMSRISGVMVIVFALGALEHGFKVWSSQSKHYKLGICCFSSNHTALRRKRKTGWLGLRRHAYPKIVVSVI